MIKGEKRQDTLTDIFFAAGIKINKEEEEKFSIYLDELKKWTKKVNLTSIRDDRGIAIKHFIDSLAPLKFIYPGFYLLDIGSGAGFPGIPIKIMVNNLRLTLVESSMKKVFFLKNIIRKLGLKEAEVLRGRAGDFAKLKEFKGVFDIVISRALFSLKKFLTEGSGFLKKDGDLIVMKGRAAKEEVEGTLKDIKKGGFILQEIEEYSLPFIGGKRHIIVLKKS